ncbi:hypothetical protein [Pseudanabaena sp. Chao 1811]|uniref:hypothetical protein n=1 Tax=Pseudanabaena sp. Chao 1811 TaxID=2963092 RepID=UPI0022F3E850|nr:hypothetical protein [Pseudanabaena sp. Chao 1811]
MAINVNSCTLSGLAIATILTTMIVDRPMALANEAEHTNEKLGTVRTLPSLQTRARPPLQPTTLHLGMLEKQFFEYAQDNNWAAIATIHRNEFTMHQLQPGGEGLYALPDRKLVYVRGFTANIYFESDRLVGIRLTPDNRDRALTAPELLTLVRAWFPDDALSVIYQVAPSDPRKSIVETLIGTIPKAFEQDLGKVSLPFCRTIIFPAPVPINTLSTCSLNL